MKTELYWVPGPWHGRLAIVPRPRGGDWLEDEIQAWRRAGIDTVLSLLTAEETADFDLFDEEKLCRASGIQFRSFPIADRDVPESRTAFSDLIKDLAAELASGKNIAVHCRQGIGRAALVAIGLLISSGMNAEAAIDRVGTARGLPVPETQDQRQWIASFAKSILDGPNAQKNRTPRASL